MRIFTLLLLLITTAQAQRIIDPYRFAINPDTFLPSGIEFRWVASDLNSSPVSTWTDRIQSYNLTQGTANLQPTWSTNGVLFDGSNDYLVVTNITTATQVGLGGSSPQAWLVVLQPINTTADKRIIGSANAFSGGQEFLSVGDVAGFLYESSLGNSALGEIPTNTFDFLVCNTVTNTAMVAYTNGLHGAHSAVGGSWNGSIALGKIGADGITAARSWNGTLKEIIVWSNVTFTVTQIANIHKYATNVYGFTP